MEKCVTCEGVIYDDASKYCSNKCKNKKYYKENKKRINSNTYDRQIVKSISRKLKLIDLKNGCCSKCGYNKNLATLEFHHIDESNKMFPLDARNLSNRKWESIIEEFNKCELLCANCHRELHNEGLNISVLRENIETRVKKLNILADDRVLISKCVDCDIKITSKAKRCVKCDKMKKRKTKRPKKEILLEDIKILGYKGSGRKYGVSDNTIRNWSK